MFHGWGTGVRSVAEALVPLSYRPGVITTLFLHEPQRPGPDWHAHGVTHKTLWVLHFDRLCRITLAKQRWRHRLTGETRHDRPIWDIPGSPYGLDVVFFLLAHWLLGVVGLHRLSWPWTDPRPSRRTVQRWRRRLTPQATDWLFALQSTLVDAVAPKSIDEILPTEGIPPPRGRVQRDGAAQERELQSSTWLITKGAHALSISIRVILARAASRLPATTRTST